MKRRTAHNLASRDQVPRTYAMAAAKISELEDELRHLHAVIDHLTEKLERFQDQSLERTHAYLATE